MPAEVKQEVVQKMEERVNKHVSVRIANGLLGVSAKWRRKSVSMVLVPMEVAKNL